MFSFDRSVRKLSTHQRWKAWWEELNIDNTNQLQARGRHNTIVAWLLFIYFLMYSCHTHYCQGFCTQL
jgi:hypothetical protein